MFQERQIINKAVCNCHSEDQFSPLFDIIDCGYVYLNKEKNTSDKLNYGMQLRKILNAFINSFMPHMKEEEEVFQPLLNEHFSEEELVEMKYLVIKLHLQKRKQNDEANKIDLNIDNSTNSVTKETRIDELPNELLLKIFSYLNCRELLNTAKVSRAFNLLSYDPSNWTSLSFSKWINEQSMYIGV